MLYIAYLREQADYYRELAEKWVKANRPEEALECEDLAETCEVIAAEFEEHLPAG